MERLIKDSRQPAPDCFFLLPKLDDKENLQADPNALKFSETFCGTPPCIQQAVGSATEERKMPAPQDSLSVNYVRTINNSWLPL